MNKKNAEKKWELFQEAGRQFSDSTLLFHELLAEKAGLAGADHKYLGILLKQGSMTAGELALQTGLTTGAITGVIDRLEKKGLVKRKKDELDRRKVVLEPNQEKAMKLFGPLFRQLMERLSELYSGYTAHESATITDFMNKYVTMIRELIEELKKK